MTFANYSVNGELLLDTANFDKQITSAADKLKQLTTALETLGEINELANTIEKLEELSGVSKEDAKVMDELKTKYEEVGTGANDAGSKIDSFKSKISSTVSAMARYNTQAKTTYSTNLSTAQSFNRLGALAQTAGKRIEGMTYMMRRLRSMGTMVATIFAWDMAMGMIESTKSTIEAKAEMESYYSVLGMGTYEIESFNNTLDNTISKFAKVNKFHLGETLASLAVEFDLSQDEMNKAANVVPMIMNEYLRAGRTTEEATLAVKDIMQGEFMRLSRETGVGKEELKAAGWSGDTKDINTLMEALEKIGSSRHWETFAAKANSLNDVVLITENRFTEFAASITDKITPWVVRGFNGLIFAFDGLTQAYNGMDGFGQAVTQITLWGGAMTGLVTLIESRGIPALKEYANARMANMMGLNAEVAKVEGITSAYAAATYAETAENAVKEKSILTEYEKVAASQASAAGKEYEAMINKIATTAVEEEITAEEALIIAKQELEAETIKLNAITEVETALMEELAIATEETSLAKSEQYMTDKLGVSTLKAKSLALEAESLAATSSMDINEARTVILNREKVAELSTSKMIAIKIMKLDAEAVAQGGLTGALYAKIAGVEASEAAITAEAFATEGATVKTKLFTAALLSNPVFLGATAAIGAVVGALWALNEATKEVTNSIHAYNELLDNGEQKISDMKNSVDQYKNSITGLTEKRNKYLSQGKSVVSIDSQINEQKQRLVKTTKELTRVEKAYQQVQAADTARKDKKKEIEDEIVKRQYERDKKAGLVDARAEIYMADGLNYEEAKGMMYLDEAYSKYDLSIAHVEGSTRQYIKTLQKQGYSLAGATEKAKEFQNANNEYAKAWLEYDIADTFWDKLKGIGSIVLASFSEIGPTVDMLFSQLAQKITDWLTGWWNDFDIMSIFSQSSSNSTGTKSIDWGGAGQWILSLFGLDDASIETTKTNISTKLQDIISITTSYLNPMNWLGDSGGAIIDWWNTNIADPISSVLSVFGVDVHIKGKKAGSNIKQGLDEGSKGSDTEVKQNIDPIGDVLSTAKGTLGSLANSLGLNIKSNTRSGSKGAHKPVADEAQDMYDAIKNKQGSIWDVAFSTAQGIVGWIAKGLNRHSPGDSAKMTLQEMNDMMMFINQSQSGLYNSAYGAGRSIVQGMADSNLNSMQNNQALTFGLNDATLANTSNTYNQLNGIVNTSFNNMDSTITNTGSTIDNTLSSMADTAKNSYKDMATNTTTEMSNVSLTNEQYLNSMADSTLSTTAQMTNAWNSMKNKIVNAANQIKSQSYGHFSSLHRSIASFYNQLATAHFSAGLSAGAPTTRFRRARVGRTYGSTGGRIKTAGGLSSMPQTHVNKIMNTAYPWKIADPWFLGIQIPMGNKVGDFKNGATSKKVSYSNFEGILAKILTARGFNNPDTYEFYYNSRKSNQQVWDSVGCNCYDGAEMILEIASMLGLSGGLVNGSWNGIGHTGAMIGGKLYDMTQFQKHGVFRGTQGVVFGTNSGTSRHSAGRGANSTTNNAQTVNKYETKIDVDLSNSQIYGIDDLDNKIDKIFNDKLIKLHGNNPATGY